MKIAELEAAHYSLNKIKEIKHLKEELKDREVNFVEGDRKRALGMNQLDRTLISDLEEAMKKSAMKWFDDYIVALENKLKSLGIEQ